MVLYQFVFGYLGQWDSFFRSDLWDALEPIFMALYYWDEYNISCAQIGFIFGEIPNLILNYGAPSQKFFQSVDDYDIRAFKMGLSKPI